MRSGRARGTRRRGRRDAEAPLPFRTGIAIEVDGGVRSCRGTRAGEVRAIQTARADASRSGDRRSYTRPPWTRGDMPRSRTDNSRRRRLHGRCGATARLPAFDQHAGDLGDRGFEVGDVLQRHEHHGEIYDAARDGKAARVADDDQLTTRLVCQAAHRGSAVDRHDPMPTLAEKAAEATFIAREVERAASRFRDQLEKTRPVEEPEEVIVLGGAGETSPRTRFRFPSRIERHRSVNDLGSGRRSAVRTLHPSDRRADPAPRRMANDPCPSKSLVHTGRQCTSASEPTH